MPLPMQVVSSLQTQRDITWAHDHSPASRVLPAQPFGTFVTWTVHKEKGPGPLSGLEPPGRAPLPHMTTWRSRKDLLLITPT